MKAAIGAASSSSFGAGAPVLSFGAASGTFGAAPGAPAFGAPAAAPAFGAAPASAFGAWFLPFFLTWDGGWVEKESGSSSSGRRSSRRGLLQSL